MNVPIATPKMMRAYSIYDVSESGPRKMNIIYDNRVKSIPAVHIERMFILSERNPDNEPNSICITDGIAIRSPVSETEKLFTHCRKNGKRNTIPLVRI
jgi:hypothetical protein